MIASSAVSVSQRGMNCGHSGLLHQPSHSVLVVAIEPLVPRLTLIPNDSQTVAKLSSLSRHARMKRTLSSFEQVSRHGTGSPPVEQSLRPVTYRDGTKCYLYRGGPYPPGRPGTLSREVLVRRRTHLIERVRAEHPRMRTGGAPRTESTRCSHPGRLNGSPCFAKKVDASSTWARVTGRARCSSR